MTLTTNHEITEGITKLGLFPFANNILPEIEAKKSREKKPEKSW